MRGVQIPIVVEEQGTTASDSWNASTTLIRALHERMMEQGWAHGPTVEIPCVTSGQATLPSRPLDLGVGLWR